MIENFLKSIKTEGEARFTLNNTAWDLSKQTVLISLVEKTIILLIDMFLFASLVFVSIVLFFFNRQKENGVQILMGIPALTRWKIWILTWILMLVGLCGCFHGFDAFDFFTIDYQSVCSDCAFDDRGCCRDSNI